MSLPDQEAARRCNDLFTGMSMCVSVCVCACVRVCVCTSLQKEFDIPKKLSERHTHPHTHTYSLSRSIPTHAHPSTRRFQIQTAGTYGPCLASLQQLKGTRTIETKLALNTVVCSYHQHGGGNVKGFFDELSRVKSGIEALKISQQEQAGDDVAIVDVETALLRLNYAGAALRCFSYVYIYSNIYIYPHVYMYVCVCVCVCKYIYVFICVYMCFYTYIYIFVYMCEHISNSNTRVL